MISVVVPTLWRFPPFLNFVQQLVELSVIEEVIIVNNNIEMTPTHPVLAHSKVRLLSFQQNIFVNPAWNLGVQLSQSDKICIINDDVIVDLKLFFVMDEFLSKDMGLVGLCPGRPEFNQPSITDGNICFQPWIGEHTFGFGSLFFVDKNNWNPIPNDLNVYYGDNWAFDTQIRMCRTNWIITNCFYYSPWAASTSTINMNEWMDKETPVYRKALQDIALGIIKLY